LLKMAVATVLLLQAAARPVDPPGLAEALAAGDDHFARRADSARGGIAQPLHAERAIVEYRRAVALDPGSYHVRLRLLRAYFFRGGFCGPMDSVAKK
jgi:hypothetical protein